MDYGSVENSLNRLIYRKKMGEKQALFSIKTGKKRAKLEFYF